MGILADMSNQMVEMKERIVNTGDDFSDPQNTYATITRKEYEDFTKNFGGFEDQLLADTNDTSLIDRAEEEARTQSRVSEGIQQRNIERYGTELTAAERQQMSRSNQRAGQLGVVGNLNDARLAQYEANQTLRANMSNIAAGVYGGAIQGLGNASSNAAQRQQAYKNAQAQTRANSMNAVGELGSTIAMIAMLSDVRLKDNLELVGKYKEHNIYTWEWNVIAQELNVMTPTFGVLAQEVLTQKPEAVTLHDSGYLMVNYGAL
tara:strand:- start:501 stop:1286 length:786 start_codon:yes stop_codon:yes gene_type:complete